MFTMSEDVFAMHALGFVCENPSVVLSLRLLKSRRKLMRQAL